MKVVHFFKKNEWSIVHLVRGCLILACESSVIITASFVGETMFLFRCLLNSLGSAAVHAALLPLLRCPCCPSTLRYFLWERNLVPHSESWECSSLGSWQHERSLSFNFRFHYSLTKDIICQIRNKISTLYI